MILYVVLPESIGAIDADVSLLTEREKLARADRMEALAELEALDNAGYETTHISMKYTDQGVFKVFQMERLADQTDLDPQTRVSYAAPHSRP